MKAGWMTGLVTQPTTSGLSWSVNSCHNQRISSQLIRKNPGLNGKMLGRSRLKADIVGWLWTVLCNLLGTLCLPLYYGQQRQFPRLFYWTGICFSSQAESLVSASSQTTTATHCNFWRQNTQNNIIVTKLLQNRIDYMPQYHVSFLLGYGVEGYSQPKNRNWNLTLRLLSNMKRW